VYKFEKKLIAYSFRKVVQLFPAVQKAMLNSATLLGRV